MTHADSSGREPASGPDFILERELMAQGFAHVAGIDEAGRGPLAGPVVVAAVILDPENIPDGLNDSKKLTAKRREAIFEQIILCARITIVSAPPETIENLNIRGATLWAMAKAASSLSLPPDYALVDGRDVPGTMPCPAKAVIKGDGRSLSIAAASIVAKVVRDHMCTIMDADAPEYGFSSHKGYGSARHMAALHSLGASAHHRALFAPVAAALALEK